MAEKAETSNGAATGAKRTKTASTAKKTTNSKASSAKSSAKSSAWNFDSFNGTFESVRERFDDVPGQMKENLEAVRSAANETAQVLRDSSSIAVDGVRTVNLQLLENAQADWNRFFEATRSLIEAKDFREAFEIQSEFVQEAVQAQVKQVREVSELTVEKTKESFEPISSGVTNLYTRVKEQRASA